MNPSWIPSAGSETGDPRHAVPSDDDVSLQADLERARGEYALHRLDPTANILQDLIPKLRANLQRAAQPAPEFYPLLLASARCLDGRLHGRKNDKKAACDAFEESTSLFDAHSAAIPIQKANSRLYTDYGIALYRIKRLAQAIEVLEQACDTGAAPAEAFGYLGLAYRDTKRFSDALNSLDKGLQLSPGDLVLSGARAETLELEGKRLEAVGAYCEAARIAIQGGDPEESERLLSRALDLDPNHDQALFLSAIVARWRGDARQALALVNRSLDAAPDDNWALALKGTLLYDAGDRKAAIELFRRVKVASPEFSWVLVQLAEALRDGAPAADAERLALLDRAIELNRNDPDAFLLKASILEATDGKQAEAVLESAAQQHPLSAAVQLALAQVALKNHNNSTAADAFDTVLQIDRKSVPALIGKAQLLENKAQLLEQRPYLDEALTMLRRAARVEPDNFEVLKRVVRILDTLDRKDEALEELAAAIHRDPGSWKAYWLQGRIFMSCNRLPQAVQSLEKAAQIRPDNGSLQADLGEALRQLDRYEEARDAFDGALKLAPDSSDVILFKSFYLCDTAAFREAIQLLQHGAQLDAENATIYMLLGWAWQHLGRGEAENAEHAFRRSLELEPDTLAAKKGLANILYDTGRRDEAKRMFDTLIKEHATSSGGVDVEVISMLGWCYYRLRRYDEAARLLQSSLGADPDSITVHFDLALTLLASGRATRAKTEYETAIDRAKSKHPLRQRGLFYIALYDLVGAMGEVPTQGREASQIYDRLSEGLERSGIVLAEVPWLRVHLTVSA